MQSKVEIITDEALRHTQKELGVLIGADIEIGLQFASLTQKDGFIETVSGRNCIIGLELNGTYEGGGCLIMPQDSVIRLGSKLLMLPPAEINELIKEEPNGEEVEEIKLAFDEIVKCLLRSFIEPFQSSNSTISSVRFKEQQIVVDRQFADSLDHLPGDQTYYQIKASLTVSGVLLDEFWLLLPAFILVSGAALQQKADHSSLPYSGPLKHTIRITSSHSTNGEIGKMMASLVTAFEGELRNFLGPAVRIQNGGIWQGAAPEISARFKATDHVYIPLSIEGEITGYGMLLAQPEDAARLGLLLTEGIHGAFVALAGDTSFSADCQDGFLEICTLLVDVMASIWDDEAGRDQVSLRAGPDVQQAIAQGDEDADFFTAESYLWCALGVITGDLDCGTVNLIVPADLCRYWDLDKNNEDLAYVSRMEQTSSFSREGDERTESPIETAVASSEIRVLLLEYSQVNASAVHEALEDTGIECEIKTMAEELNKTGLDSYRVTILAVDKLDELALAAVIKVKSISSAPLLVVASEWTQTDVFKAVRFGVDDILMIPLDKEEIVQKITGGEQLATPE